jgi:hypothetical protein
MESVELIHTHVSEVYPFFSCIAFALCEKQFQKKYSETEDTWADRGGINKPPAGTKLRFGSMVAL